MSDNTPADNVDVDLDAFSADFFGRKPDTPVETKTEKQVKDEVSEADATPDAHSEPDDTGSEPEDTTDDGSTPDETAAKPKKTRFQERIDELTAKAREAERERDELREKLKGQNPEPAKKQPVATELVEPQPTDTNEDGTDKYELGEFDPKYIKDLTKFALKSEKAALEAESNRAADVAEMNRQKEELETSWSQKLPTAQERYPDFREKGEELIDTFAGINAAYGEYLSATIMGLDNGTDVLYYLATNVDEANKIVAAGPAKAAVMLGKIDSKFDTTDEPGESEPVRKISKAPTPPPTNRGVSAARATIPDDTDDLDAFSQKLFDKRYGKRR